MSIPLFLPGFKVCSKHILNLFKSLGDYETVRHCFFLFYFPIVFAYIYCTGVTN